MRALFCAALILSMLKIYNTLSRSKEEFKAIEAGKIRIYVCGITVYDHLHLGHARMLLVFDMVTRYLRMRGYEVRYVRNITDIDDKIIKRAHENGESIQDLTARFIAAMHEDEDALAILRPDQEPRATGHIDAIIAMINKLIEKKYAYAADNGDVFYDVSAYPEYGQLSGKKTDELRVGKRVHVQEVKDDPLDFALWKAGKEGEPGWDSPWGPGRPGWHIECSAMSTQCLGEHFDIHGGGQDLQFPHHENEIAQSCGASGQPFVNCWMHNGFVRVDQRKMSKSLGNFFTVRELLKKYQAEVIRFFILSSHYRSPLHYSDAHLDEAKAALEGFYISLREVGSGQGEVQRQFVEQFQQVMDDDFNTPRALAILHALAHDINRATDKNASAVLNLAATLRYLAGVLGILQEEPEAFLRAGPSGADELSDAKIEHYIQERAEAKTAKNYQRADEIRALLAAQKIILEDGAEKTTWRRA